MIYAMQFIVSALAAFAAIHATTKVGTFKIERRDAIMLALIIALVGLAGGHGFYLTLIAVYFGMDKFGSSEGSVGAIVLTAVVSLSVWAIFYVVGARGTTEALRNAAVG